MQCNITLCQIKQFFGNFLVQNTDTQTNMSILSCNPLDIEDDDEQGDNDDDTAEDVGNIQTKVSIDDVAAGKYQLIYAHPEAFLSSREGRKILHSKILHDHVCGICIDEAHMIQEWYDIKKAFANQKLIFLWNASTHAKL